MTKKPMYLKYYKEWMKDEKLPSFSLCFSLPEKLRMNKYFNLIKPTNDDLINLSDENKNLVYWGSDSYHVKMFQFTELRQTLLLIAAALNNEL